VFVLSGAPPVEGREAHRIWDEREGGEMREEDDNEHFGSICCNRAIAFLPQLWMSIMILPPLSLSVHFYPYFLKMKPHFTPTPWTPCNDVRNVDKRQIWPCECTPTFIRMLWFYPYLTTFI
jgi:hypothetical protein